MNERSDIRNYLLLLGDSPLILGHRLSELCGHGPSLETDIALTNISLDLFGQVRNYFQYAAELDESGKTEDDLAFLRLPHEYRNVQLTEIPNQEDFAIIIGRQFLFDAYHLPLLNALTVSKNTRIAGIAEKSLKEVKYHLRFSSEWIKRLGDGTEFSHLKMQQAIEQLWPYTPELGQETSLERQMWEMGIGADLQEVHKHFQNTVREVLAEATISLPSTDGPQRPVKGKEGVHTEHLGYILAELQYMQRAYPNMSW